MKYIAIYLAFIIIFPLKTYSITNDCPFEQIALNYFSESIISHTKRYNGVKYFVFDGKLDTKNSIEVNICMIKNESQDTLLDINCSKELIIPSQSK
jgi:hypothetical protein